MVLVMGGGFFCMNYTYSSHVSGSSIKLIVGRRRVTLK